MRKIALSLLFLILTVKSFPQISSLKGSVTDESGSPVGFAPAVLLNPADSTLAFFSVTDNKGKFELKGIRNGDYLFQVAFIGHTTFYKRLSFPADGGVEMETIVLLSKPVTPGEVTVAEEYIPMQFRKDTIEYNTVAFPVKPDAVVEDLLKKLPGIDVDRAGNIKALGEDIKKVLVDGREFFGNDPRLATRNVPADALRKIQVYDKKSEEAEFTGIDDGIRDKTLNLLLKDDKKNAVFGELLGGAGPGGYYQGSTKVYRFTDRNQFAALGMMNNINQFGFSFKDYIDFSGGMQNAGGHGGAVQISIPSGGGTSFPVNFGQPVNGLSTSGAAGLNFSRLFGNESRFFISYVGNGSQRDLVQNTSSRNFTDQGSFREKENLDEEKLDIAHRFNFGLRYRIDTTQNLIVNGDASLSYGNKSDIKTRSLFNGDNEKNRLFSVRDDNARRFSGNVSGSYQKIIDKGKAVFRISSDAALSKDIGNSGWMNQTLFFDPAGVASGDQYQHFNSYFTDFSAASSLSRRLTGSFFIEPGLKTGFQYESLNRLQSFTPDLNERIDSLSPEFSRVYKWARPSLSLIRNSEKTQFTFALQTEFGSTTNELNGDRKADDYHFYLTPWLSFEYEYKTGRRLRLYYQTGINVPSSSQLLPVADVANPLALSIGNRNLHPEVTSNISLNWWIFDQFSFTTFLTGLNATYTSNKINWNRTIDSDLKQTMTLINVPVDYRVRASADFSTAVRSLGVKINTNLEETWNRGISFINGTENINTNLIQKISLSIENRKKTKWDIIAGAAFQMTDANFSIQKSLNNKYYDLSYFTELRYNPDEHWNFNFSADITDYSSRSFTESINIPLLGAEVSYYFLKNNRAAAIFKVADMLNSNTGIERTSDLNFLRERRSGMLGRLFMFSLRYRLNRFGTPSGTVDVKVNRR